MIKIIKKIVLNPFLLFAIISFLECIPIKGPKIYDDMPKEKENFKIATSDSVFYFFKGGKYFYESEECYYKFGNLPFSKTYEEGGIKFVTPEIANRIPLRGPMCGDQKLVNKNKKSHGFFEKYFNFGYVFMNFSSLSHFLFYAYLAFTICLYVLKNTNKYWFSFFACMIGGGLLELIQFLFIEGRSASFQDFFLNTIGSLFGIYFFKLLHKRTKLVEKLV